MKTEIFDYGMNGEGVGKIDNKIVLVPSSMVGEIVDVEIIEDNKNYSVGKFCQHLRHSFRNQIFQFSSLIKSFNPFFINWVRLLDKSSSEQLIFPLNQSV